MKWLQLWLIPSAVAFVISLITGIWWIFFLVFIGWIVILGIFRCIFYADEYQEWIKGGRKGDHPWFEWTWCCECYWSAMDDYDPKTYCKIDMKTFEKYFAVNPSRYKFNYSCVEFDNEDDSVKLLMVFPRKDLRKFFEFRRNYLQSRRMVNVINFVQSDIDKMREDAQAYIDKARAMMNHEFGSELNGTERNDS